MFLQRSSYKKDITPTRWWKWKVMVVGGDTVYKSPFFIYIDDPYHKFHKLIYRFVFIDCILNDSSE